MAFYQGTCARAGYSGLPGVAPLPNATTWYSRSLPAALFGGWVWTIRAHPYNDIYNWETGSAEFEHYNYNWSFPVVGTILAGHHCSGANMTGLAVDPWADACITKTAGTDFTGYIALKDEKICTHYWMGGLTL